MPTGGIADGMGRAHRRRPPPGTAIRAAALGALVGVCVAGCALSTAGDADTGLRVSVPRPLPLPAGSAHTIFQGGRIVRAASLFEPFCELEVNTVAPERRSLPPGSYRVTAIGQRLLRDPITRIPAVPQGLDCSDGLFQESQWRLTPAAADAGPTADARHLRCIAPYFDCRLGPPLSVDQVQLVVGRHLRIEVAGP
jgi:hypothetical protein